MKMVEDTIYESLVPGETMIPSDGNSAPKTVEWTDEEKARYLRENYSDSYNFNESVKNGDNNLRDYANDKDYKSDKEK